MYLLKYDFPTWMVIWQSSHFVIKVTEWFLLQRCGRRFNDGRTAFLLKKSIGIVFGNVISQWYGSSWLILSFVGVDQAFSLCNWSIDTFREVRSLRILQPWSWTWSQVTSDGVLMTSRFRGWRGSILNNWNGCHNWRGRRFTSFSRIHGLTSFEAGKHRVCEFFLYDFVSWRFVMCVSAFCACCQLLV